MLERLTIRDFAVARSVEICPGPGLNVFTGETGAGKSLVVDALAFVLGARRGREVIAAGADRATVEATLIGSDGDTVNVERTIGASGRSSARRDGEVTTLDDLQALAQTAVDIHGQSEQLAILRPAEQLLILDAFAGLFPQRAAVAASVRELRQVRRQLASLLGDSRERERLIDQLTFERDEIAAAALTAGEDDQLRAELGRLSNATRLIEDAEAALAALDAPAVGEAVRSASAVAARDSTAVDVGEGAAAFESAAAELVRSMRHYRESIEEDPARLAAVQERLDQIARLRRKYGDTVDDILRYAAEVEERLRALTGASMDTSTLQARETALLEELAAAASELSSRRRHAAGGLVQAVSAELEQLGMARATLTIGFAVEDDADGLAVSVPDYEMVFGTPAAPAGSEETHRRAFTESGVDRIEFMASFNPGESPRPLGAVASGGETSRFLLALTAVLGASAEPRIVVFDEVDEGVGGRAGALIGEALLRLAERHQVLCVTHLPQVAAFASRHFVVTKTSDATGTWSEVREVCGEERVAELAEMLGGVTDATLATARELLGANSSKT